MTGAIFSFGRFQLNVFNRFIVLNNVFNPYTPSVGGKVRVLYISINNREYPLFSSVGGKIKLLKKEQFYLKANAGINYHYPSLNDLYWNPGGNDSLKSEKAEMTEAGFSYTKNTGNTEITLDVVGFYNYVSNWIIWLPTEYSYWSPTNLKEVENKGIEATLSINSTFSKLTIKHNANYAYTASTNIKTPSVPARAGNNESDNSINKQLIYVPFHKFNYTLSAAYKKTSIYYNYSYTGLRFISTDNNWYMPEYFIHNASISQKINIKKLALTGSFKVNNLLNQDYQSMAYRAMPGRNFLFSISLGL
jgi:iron complex outermembrane receptor protein